MSEKKIFSHFNLLLKIKNQSVKNKPSNKKFYIVKEIELLDGENMIGSDICKCNIYLPFEQMPAVMGKLTVRTENSSKKLFLTDFEKSEEHFLSKFIGKNMVSNKEHFIKPHQKIFVGEMIEMIVQKVFIYEQSSVCFEEDLEEFNKEFEEVQSENQNTEVRDNGKVNNFEKLESSINDQEDQQIEEELTNAVKPSEKTILKKRGEEALVDGELNNEDNLKQLAENVEILEEVENPFNENKTNGNTKKVKAEEKFSISTPIKRKKGLKKVQLSEKKTSHKIDSFFKTINKSNTDKENTIIKKQSTEIETIEAFPMEIETNIIEEPRQLFLKNPNLSKKSFEDIINEKPFIAPVKYEKGSCSLVSTVGDSMIENNLEVLGKAIFQKGKGVKSGQSELLVDQKILRKEVRVSLLNKADLIHEDLEEQITQMVEDLKQIAKFTWWVCFSNIKINNKHLRIVKVLNSLPNVEVFEDFEQFVEQKREDVNIRKVLVMDNYKRTYKLIVAMNRNILPLSYKWVENIASEKSIFKNPTNFFLKYPKSSKLPNEFNKNNSSTWFEKHSHKFTIDLKKAYFLRKNSEQGFLQNHNVIILDKCFINIKVENLNIKRPEDEIKKRKLVVRAKKNVIRSSQKENDNGYIMRRIVETADGILTTINSLDKFKEVFKPNVVNVLVVDSYDYPELTKILEEHRIMIFSKESFLSAFMKQYLHINESFKPPKIITA